MSKVISLTLVGVRYRVTGSTLHKVTQQIPLEVKLEREPKNPHDKNAIRVILTEKPFKGMHIGYIKGGEAVLLSPKLRRGSVRILSAQLTSLDESAGEGDLAVTIRKES